MTDKQVNIIELAKEAGLLADDSEVWLPPYQEAMERFTALVRAEVLAEQAQLQQAKEMLFAVDDVVKQSIDDIKTLSCAGFVLPTMTLKTEASQVKTMTPEEYKTFIEPVKQEPVAWMDLHKELGQLRWMGGDEGWDNAIHAVRKRLEELYAAPVDAKAIREPLADNSGDANEMVADTNPLSVFAKECVLGAYTYDELPEAARLALKRAKKAEPWKCACGANLYINSDGAPTSRLKPVKQEPVAVISEFAIGFVKLHANGVSLPFGTQLYAAPVSAKREWVDMTKAEQLYLLASHIDKLTGDVMGLSLIDAVVAKFKEKNK